MFVWMSGFQNSLAHTDFNTFVDVWTSSNESPDRYRFVCKVKTCSRCRRRTLMAHAHCTERGRERDRKANGLLYFMQNCSHYAGIGNGTGHHWFHTNFSVPGSVQCV